MPNRRKRISCTFTAYDVLGMDDLTGLLDAREFLGSLPTLASSERVSLVLFDVDDVRVLNEQHGEQRVDQLLAHLGSVIQERCGPGELAARIGGDEFALSLFEDDVNEVVREVEKIRRRFGEESDGATVSVGVSDVATLRRHSGSPSLFEAAEEALLDAKTERPSGLKIFRPPI